MRNILAIVVGGVAAYFGRNPALGVLVALMGAEFLGDVALALGRREHLVDVLDPLFRRAVIYLGLVILGAYGSRMAGLPFGPGATTVAGALVAYQASALLKVLSQLGGGGEIKAVEKAQQDTTGGGGGGGAPSAG